MRPFLFGSCDEHNKVAGQPQHHSDILHCAGPAQIKRHRFGRFECLRCSSPYAVSALAQLEGFNLLIPGSLADLEVLHDEIASLVELSVVIGKLVQLDERVILVDGPSPIEEVRDIITVEHWKNRSLCRL